MADRSVFAPVSLATEHTVLRALGGAVVAALGDGHSWLQLDRLSGIVLPGACVTGVQLQLSPSVVLEVQHVAPGQRAETLLPLSSSSIGASQVKEAPKTFLPPRERACVGSASRTAYLCLPLLADASAEAASAMLVATSKQDDAALWATWQQYSGKSQVIGAMLLTVRPHTQSPQVVDLFLSNALLMATLVGPLLIDRSLSWLAAIAARSGLLKLDVPASYVLGKGFIVGPACSESCGTAGTTENQRIIPTTATLEEEDERTSEGTDESSLMDFLLSVAELSQQELQNIPTEVLEVAVAAMGVLAPERTSVPHLTPAVMQWLRGDRRGQPLAAALARAGAQTGPRGRATCRDPGRSPHTSRDDDTDGTDSPIYLPQQEGAGDEQGIGVGQSEGRQLDAATLLEHSTIWASQSASQQAAGSWDSCNSGPVTELWLTDAVAAAKEAAAAEAAEAIAAAVERSAGPSMQQADKAAKGMTTDPFVGTSGKSNRSSDDAAFGGDAGVPSIGPGDFEGPSKRRAGSATGSGQHELDKQAIPVRSDAALERLYMAHRNTTMLESQRVIQLLLLCLTLVCGMLVSMVPSTYQEPFVSLLHYVLLHRLLSILTDMLPGWAIMNADLREALHMAVSMSFGWSYMPRAARLGFKAFPAEPLDPWGLLYMMLVSVACTIVTAVPLSMRTVWCRRLAIGCCLVLCITAIPTLLGKTFLQAGIFAGTVGYGMGASLLCAKKYEARQRQAFLQSLQ